MQKITRNVRTPFGMVQATIHDGGNAHLGLSGNMPKLHFRDRDWYFSGNVHLVDGEWVWYTLSGCRPDVSDPYKQFGKMEAPPTFREKILAGILAAWKDFVAENADDMERAQESKNAADVLAARRQVTEAIENLRKAADDLNALGVTTPNLSFALDLLLFPIDAHHHLPK